MYWLIVRCAAGCCDQGSVRLDQDHDPYEGIKCGAARREQWPTEVPDHDKICERNGAHSGRATRFFCVRRPEKVTWPIRPPAPIPRHASASSNIEVPCGYDPSVPQQDASATVRRWAQNRRHGQNQRSRRSRGASEGPSRNLPRSHPALDAPARHGHRCCQRTSSGPSVRFDGASTRNPRATNSTLAESLVGRDLVPSIFCHIEVLVRHHWPAEKMANPPREAHPVKTRN